MFSINLIGKLLSELEINECDMIVPKIMYHDEQNRIWAAGGYFNRFAAYSGNIYGSDEIDIGQFDTSREIECSPTCCMLIQSSVFSKVGLMDEKYFVYCDDSDFCYRTMVNGVKLWYASTITLYHKASSLTGGKFSEFTIYYTVRNRIYYIHKNLSPVMYPFWVLFCYLRYSLPTLAGQDTWKIFLLKQKAIFEGLKMSTKNSSK